MKPNSRFLTFAESTLRIVLTERFDRDRIHFARIRSICAARWQHHTRHHQTLKHARIVNVLLLNQCMIFSAPLVGQRRKGEKQMFRGNLNDLSFSKYFNMLN